MECKALDAIINGLNVYKPKVKYDSLMAATEVATWLNKQPKQIVNVLGYKCAECGKYHIGRNGKQTKKRIL